ncbi:AMP-activated serine/threonine-protein kinase regulatory subunit, partial [Serendipita sp. 407]
TVDVTTLVRSGTYTKLDLSIRSALTLRSSEFPGAVTCTSSDSLGKLLEFIKGQRIHRLVVVEGEGPNKGKLAGIITLSDVLRYIVGGTPAGGGGIAGAGGISMSPSAASSLNVSTMGLSSTSAPATATSSAAITPAPSHPGSPPPPEETGQN